jgi:hypothetical protein
VMQRDKGRKREHRMVIARDGRSPEDSIVATFLRRGHSGDLPTEWGVNQVFSTLGKSLYLQSTQTRSAGPSRTVSTVDGFVVSCSNRIGFPFLFRSVSIRLHS